MSYVLEDNWLVLEVTSPRCRWWHRRCWFHLLFQRSFIGLFEKRVYPGEIWETEPCNRLNLSLSFFFLFVKSNRGCIFCWTFIFGEYNLQKENRIKSSCCCCCIHPEGDMNVWQSVVETFHSKPRMSTSWWRMRKIHPVGFGRHPKSHAISKQETHDGLMLKQLHACMPRKMWAQKCRQAALEM